MLHQVLHDFQAPLSQLLVYSQPSYIQQHIQILLHFANNTKELNKLVQELEYQYIHDAQAVYLGLLYILIDFMGVSLLTRPQFQTFCKNINQIPFTAPSAAIAIVITELVFTKMTPLDEDVRSPELQEIFIMNNRAVMAYNTNEVNIPPQQSIVDCYYELLRQLVQLRSIEDEIVDDQFDQLGCEDQTLNNRLKTLQMRAKQCFKTFELPLPLHFNASEKEREDRKGEIYSILIENFQEIENFIFQNNVTNADAEFLSEFKNLIKEVTHCLKDQNPLLRDQFSLQKLELSTHYFKKNQIPSQPIPLSQRACFSKFEMLTPDVDVIQYEFQALHWPVRDPEKMVQIQSTLSGFLNSKGGVLYFGIKEQVNQVTGVDLTAIQREEFKVMLQQLCDKIFPQPDPNKILNVQFLAVKNKFNVPIPGVFVVRVHVQQGELDKFYVFKSQTTNEIVGYQWIDGTKKTCLFPEIFQLTYNFALQPREATTSIRIVDPDQIRDLYLQEEQPEPEYNYIGRIKKFSKLKLEKKKSNNLQVEHQRPSKTMSVEGRTMSVEGGIIDQVVLQPQQQQVIQKELKAVQRPELILPSSLSITQQQSQNSQQQPKQQSLFQNPQPQQPITKVKQNQEDFKMFKIIFHYELIPDQMELVINQILGDLVQKKQEFQIRVLNHHELDIIFTSLTYVDALHARILKSASSIKKLQVVRTIKYGQKTIFDLPPELLESLQKQSQNSQIVFGFIKMDYTQKQNLLSATIRLLQELQIKPLFVWPFDNSILIGFPNQSILDSFVYAILSQHQLFRKFGYQQNLMGGKVSRKLTFRGIPQDIIKQLQPAFKVEFGSNQDGSGFIQCTSEEDTAKIFDYLLIMKNKLKKGTGQNKIEVLWQLEALLVNIK